MPLIAASVRISSRFTRWLYGPAGCRSWGAGGTNLVELMKLGVAGPRMLVDISRLGLDTVEHRSDGSVLIGAGVKNAALAGDTKLRTAFPVLAQAVLSGASG